MGRVSLIGPAHIGIINMNNKQIDLEMLRKLVKQANGFGARLRVYKPKSNKYEYCITGTDEIGRNIRMGGTAFWLYDELLKQLTNYY